MSFRAPPVVPPGPLTPADAAALSLYLRELSQCFGSITGAPPISVVQGVSGVNITFDDTGMQSPTPGMTFSGASYTIASAQTQANTGFYGDVTWDTAYYDTDTYLSGGTGFQVALPFVGYYHVDYNVQWEDNIVGSRDMFVLLQATSPVALCGDKRSATNSGLGGVNQSEQNCGMDFYNDSLSNVLQFRTRIDGLLAGTALQVLPPSTVSGGTKFSITFLGS